MSHSQRRRLQQPKATNWRTVTADTIKKTRATLGAQVQFRMSNYTNLHLWRDPANYAPASIDKTDPQDIQELKTFFLILQYAENALRSGKNVLRLINELIGIYNCISNLPALSQKLYSSLTEITTVINILKKGNYTPEKIGEKIQSILANLTTRIHHQVIALVDYRPATPTNPAETFNRPPLPSTAWWSTTPAIIHITEETRRNFEYDYLLNPVRKLRIGLQEIFPDLKFDEVPMDEHGFLITAELEESKITFRSGKTLFQSVNALYNVMWSINRISRAYTNPEELFGKVKQKVKSVFQAKEFILEHLLKKDFWEIDLSDNIPKEIISKINALYKKYLEELRDVFFSFRTENIDNLQQYEIENHLKPGVLTDVLRAGFSVIEDLYLANNLYFKNPFSAQRNIDEMQHQLEHKEKQEELKQLRTLQKQYKKLADQLNKYASRTLPETQSKRDEFIADLIIDITSMLTRTHHEPEKTNLENTQDLLIRELSIDGTHDLHEDLKKETKNPDENIFSLKNKVWKRFSEQQIVRPLSWWVSVGNVMGAHTPDTFKMVLSYGASFVTSFVVPMIAPSAIVGDPLPTRNRFSINQLDLRLMFELPDNHSLKNVVIMTQNPPALIYFNDTDETTLILDEEGIEKNVPFLKPFIERGTELITEINENKEEKQHEYTEESESIRHELTDTELTQLNNWIAMFDGPKHALLPNLGLLGYLRTAETECAERIQALERREQELKDGIAQGERNLVIDQFRSTMRLLEPRDLLRMIYAVNATKDHPDLNLHIKSRLAALVADVDDHGKREEYIHHAHSVAVRLVNDPTRFLVILQTLFKDSNATEEDKLLCRELMTQLALTPAFVERILSSRELLDILNYSTRDAAQNAKTAINCITCVLTQFNASDLLFMLANTINPSTNRERIKAQSLEKTLVVILFIFNKQPITNDTLSTQLVIIKSLAAKELDERCTFFLSALFNLHEQSNDQKFRENTGIFIANLALRNKQFAKTIFEFSNIHDIIKTACLQSAKKSEALYYEAWVNSLPSFKYNLRTFQGILDQHWDAIEKMHRAIHHDTQPDKAFYRAHPWELSKLQGDFITHCLSRNSEAEEIMKTFFVNTALAEGPESNTIRREIANQYYQTSGHTTASYYQFIANAPQINLFWKEQQNQIIKEIADAKEKLEREQQAIIFLFKKADDEHKSMMKTFNNEIEQRINALQVIHETLLDKTSKIPSYCTAAKRNLQIIINGSKQEIKKWRDYLTPTPSQEFKLFHNPTTERRKRNNANHRQNTNTDETKTRDSFRYGNSNANSG
jgi:hypothetical protein